MKTTANDLSRHTNGIDLEALTAAGAVMTADPAEAQTRFRVTTQWQDAMRSETTVRSLTTGSQTLRRSYRIQADEPVMLGGGCSAPNPMDLMLAALNACMLVGYACQAAQAGLQIRNLTIETDSDIDMRGFLGVAGVAPGCSVVRQVVKVDGDGTAADWLKIHRAVQATSPIYHSLTQPVRIETTLEVG